MGTWNSRGLRGSTLEELINITIEKYIDSGIALIQKIPTPIKPINIDSNSRHITLAYFEQKSTVDYIGVVQGIPICFMLRSVQKIHFLCRTFMNIRLSLWKTSKSRRGFRLLFCITVIRTKCIIYLFHT